MSDFKTKNVDLKLDGYQKAHFQIIFLLEVMKMASQIIVTAVRVSPTSQIGQLKIKLRPKRMGSFYLRNKKKRMEKKAWTTWEERKYLLLWSFRQQERRACKTVEIPILLLLPFLFPNHSKLGRWRLSITDSKLQEDIWYFFLIKDDGVQLMCLVLGQFQLFENAA